MGSVRHLLAASSPRALSFRVRRVWAVWDGAWPPATWRHREASLRYSDLNANCPEGFGE